MQLNERDWQNTFNRIYEGEVKFNEPMKDHTSLGIGGPADVMVLPVDPLSIRNMIKVFMKEEMPFLPLGWGTNIVVRDSGIAGVVISLRAFDRIEVLKEGRSQVELFVEAGVPLQKLVNLCRENGYSGVEGLTGIPGTVGGAICGNAGSFGYEMKDVLVSVAIMDNDGVLERFKAEGLGFGYRRSDILRTDIVLSANMRLKRDERAQVSARTESFFMEKKQKQPVSEKSAGCVFKNPEGMSAGRLIDEAGCKGMRKGDIEVSAVHANFLVNRGEGSAVDYISLMDEVSVMVNNKFGVVLEPEIKIIGRI
jgi:UDP-N-acetylmuramate dehydrogenase